MAANVKQHLKTLNDAVQALGDAQMKHQAAADRLRESESEVARIDRWLKDADVQFVQLQGDMHQLTGKLSDLNAKLEGAEAERNSDSSAAFKSPTPESLKKALGSEHRYAAARTEQARVRADIDRAKDDVETGKGRKIEAERKLEQAKVSVAEAKTVATEAEARVQEATKEYQKKLAIVGGGAGANEPDLPSPEVLTRVFGRGQESTDILSITTRDIGVDPLAAEVIRNLSERSASPELRRTLINELLKESRASDIDAVTKLLNRRRMSDIRRLILSATYPGILRKQIKTHSVKAAKDRVGLASNIVAALEEEGGPLDEFSKMLASAAIAKIGLDDSGERRSALLTAQIRASL